MNNGGYDVFWGPAVHLWSLLNKAKFFFILGPLLKKKDYESQFVYHCLDLQRDFEIWKNGRAGWYVWIEGWGLYAEWHRRS